MFGNTKQKGHFTFVAWKEKPDYYIGVNLEFDLLVEGETLQEAIQHIEKMSKDYLEIVRKNNWEDSLLNQPAHKEYWKKAIEILEKQEEMVRALEEAKRQKAQQWSFDWSFTTQHYHRAYA